MAHRRTKLTSYRCEEGSLPSMVVAALIAEGRPQRFIYALRLSAGRVPSPRNPEGGAWSVQDIQEI